MFLFADSLIRRLRGNHTLPFSLRITIGSVVLIYSISEVAILAFSINSISYVFQPFDILVAIRKAWRFISLPGEERGSRCILLIYYWVIVTDYSLEYSHVSTRMVLLWAGVNLRVPWFLIKFILVLPYKLSSFKFGSLFFGWYCTNPPEFCIK